MAGIVAEDWESITSSFLTSAGVSKILPAPTSVYIDVTGFDCDCRDDRGGDLYPGDCSCGKFKRNIPFPYAPSFCAAFRNDEVVNRDTPIAINATARKVLCRLQALRPKTMVRFLSWCLLFDNNKSLKVRKKQNNIQNIYITVGLRATGKSEAPGY
jgi:hypothetical protein